MPNSHIGIDACKFGWIMINIIDEDYFSFELMGHISAIEKYNNDTILIDIPIGLADEFIERNLDLEAKKLLTAPKKSSIFIPPCRNAIYAENYEEAKVINKKITGKSISIQAWNISKKIKEVDQFLINKPFTTPYLQEAHPEICFTILNNGKSLESKKSTSLGHFERLTLLKKLFPSAEKIYHTIVEKTLKKDAKKDDILDAMVLAISSFISKNNHVNNINNRPLIDSKGLKISLWFP